VHGLLSYEVCIGTTPLGCQVQSFTPAVSGASSWNSSGLLQGEIAYCGAALYAAVRVSNCAGLQSTAVSEMGTTLCCDAPPAGVLSLQGGSSVSDAGTITFVSNATAELTATWGEFEGGCGGVRAYELTLHAAAGGTALWTSGVLDAEVSSFELPWASIQALLDGEGEYTVAIAATSRAGFTTSADAKLAWICTIPPIPIQDELRAVLPSGLLAPLSGVMHLSSEAASIPASCVPTVEHLAVDAVKVGWGSLIGAGDDSAARTFETSVAVVSMGQDELLTASLPSALSETVWQSRGMEAVPGQVPQLRTVGVASMSTCEDGFCMVAARTCNTVGQCSYSDWAVLAPIRFAPSVGWVDLLPTSGAVSEAFVDPSGFTVSWHGFDSVHGLLSYEVCIGTTPLGCQVQSFTPAVSGASSWNSSGLLQGEIAYCGAALYAAVRVSNCAGLQSTAVSEMGTTLCCDAPPAGVLSLQGGSSVSDAGTITFVSNATAELTATWGEFEGGCGGVRAYELTLHAAAGGTALWTSGVLDAEVSSFELPWASIQALLDGEGEYTVAIAATSRAGLTTSADAKLALDSTPPSIGVVFTGNLTDVPCRRADLPASLSWTGVTDETSGLASIEWALGTSPFAADVKPFGRISITEAGFIVRSWNHPSTFAVGQIIYSTLRVSDLAGNTASKSSTGVRILPATCEEDFVCMPPGLEPTADTSAAHGLFL